MVHSSSLAKNPGGMLFNHRHLPIAQTVTSKMPEIQLGNILKIPISVSYGFHCITCMTQTCNP